MTHATPEQTTTLKLEINSDDFHPMDGDLCEVHIEVSKTWAERILNARRSMLATSLTKSVFEIVVPMHLPSQFLDAQEEPTTATVTNYQLHIDNQSLYFSGGEEGTDVAWMSEFYSLSELAAVFNLPE